MLTMSELLFLFNVYFPPLLNLDLLTDKGEVLSLFIPVLLTNVPPVRRLPFLFHHQRMRSKL